MRLLPLYFLVALSWASALNANVSEKSLDEGDSHESCAKGLKGDLATLVTAVCSGEITETSLPSVRVSVYGRPRSCKNCPFEPGYVNVAKDYIAYESPAAVSGIRLALPLPNARAIAQRYESRLPTPAIVQAIYEAAESKLSAYTLSSLGNVDPQSFEAMVRHSQLIDDEIAARVESYELIQLVAGCKKDVVESPSWWGLPDDRLLIFGFHGRQGVPIQRPSIAHSAEYYDYSHGARLVGLYGYFEKGMMAIDNLEILPLSAVTETNKEKLVPWAHRPSFLIPRRVRPTDDMFRPFTNRDLAPWPRERLPKVSS